MAARMVRRLEGHVCMTCDAVFLATNPKQAYCSHACQQAMYAFRRRRKRLRLIRARSSGANA